MVVNPTMRRLLAVRPGIHLSAVKDISTSQRDGYSADSRPSRSDLCKSGLRPAAFIPALLNVRLTSIPDVQSLMTTVRYGSIPASRHENQAVLITRFTEQP
jgi:hypothetical protein